MADFLIQDDENVTLAIAPGPDAVGNPTTAPFDAGSVTANFPETSNLTAVVSEDQTSILVTSEGPLVVDDVLTITGTVGGVKIVDLFPMDVTASAPTAILVTPGTPQLNTPAAPAEVAPVDSAPVDTTPTDTTPAA